MRYPTLNIGAHGYHRSMTRRHLADPIDLDPSVASSVVAAAIDWFGEHGRDLPWRHTRDAWAVLVSEVMLQQLRVARTLPFYQRMITRFPTPASMAGASLGQVLDVWGDLGRYRAAAALHRTAGIIVSGHGGVVPRDVAELARLPGIGPYTAGAVACFAYEEPVAFLDTNARRVLHRVFVGVDVPDTTARPAQLRNLASRLVPHERAWAWNQALIEIGALRCRARSVECQACPVGEWCVARSSIGEALSAAPKRVAPRTRYAGTNRQFRGQVLRVLRESVDAVVSIDDVGRRVRPTYAAADRPWIDSVVTSLERDGLIHRRQTAVRAIGEEQAGYAVEGATVGGVGEGISLP